MKAQRCGRQRRRSVGIGEIESASSTKGLVIRRQKWSSQPSSEFKWRE
jgi:hypothetical protein